jgi:hypothetical protein
VKLSAVLLLASLFLADAPRHPLSVGDFQYSRSVDVPAAQSTASPNACAVLGASVFAHAAPSLDDIRVFSPSGQELPYAVTLSQTATLADSARLLNLGLKSPRHLSFDLQMPARPYSSVELQLNGRDFVASARVTGLKSLADTSPTYLGTYMIFDLTAQRLGRSSTIDFAESTFPLLHLDLTVTPAPGNETLKVASEMVAGAAVPASRIAQTLYTPVAETTAFLEQPRRTVATLTVPAHVPVERVVFELDPSYHANFDRPVTIAARPISGTRDAQPSPEERLAGEISRVRLTEAGQEVREQSLAIPAILGINGQASATIEVAIENGDDRPVKLRAVRLEMRQRKLCFAVPPELSATLAYGGRKIEAPVYDFGRLFNPAETARVAVLGRESINREYKAESVKRPFTERHPEILWVALLGVISVLGVVAFRSAKRL